MPKVMIIAGGTGGHVFPALAVAQYLRSQDVQVIWMGTRTGLEARAVPAAGFDIEWVAVRGLRRRGALAWLRLPVMLTVAMVQSLRILLRQRPQAVLAMGGFVAGPGALVAWVLHKPLLIHEQNAIPGLTNRWLVLLADHVLCGFPDAFKNFPSARHVGNPVRREIGALPPPSAHRVRTGSLCLLILGGSQGAQVFNTVMPEALRLWRAPGLPEVWHQCGSRWLESTRAAYSDTAVAARVSAFIDDMAAAYRWADLVICRAGAMTIAELCAAGRAAILVPYPHAVDAHQAANAQFLVEREAAILFPEERFVPAKVCETLQRFSANREGLLRMAQNARRCAITDAADTIGELCMEAAHA